MRHLDAEKDRNTTIFDIENGLLRWIILDTCSQVSHNRFTVIIGNKF